MALRKRKSIAQWVPKRSRKTLKKAVEEKEEAEDEAQQDQEEETLEEPEAEDGEGEAQQEQQENEENEADAWARREEETAVARKHKLKSMPVGDLKELLVGKELETGKKTDMVETLLAHEAEARAQERAHHAKIRQVLVCKKEELEALSIPELRELCFEAGLKGQLTRQARIELLLKTLTKMALDARESELNSIDKTALLKLCAKAGVDPFVKEVMVERIVKREGEAGCFARPRLEADEDEEDEESVHGAPNSDKKAGDMVEALLANEIKRQREKELKKQDEDAAANKMTELRAMSMEEMKQVLASKGSEATGKKDELVEAPAPKKRGRPPKDAGKEKTTTALAKEAPKKRGRPPKDEGKEKTTAALAKEGPAPKKRGRPPKDAGKEKTTAARRQRRS